MRIILLAVVLMFASCKPDATSKTSSETVKPSEELAKGNIKVENQTSKPNPVKNTEVGEPGVKTNYNIEGIPDACDLLTTKTISKYVRQPAETIFLADGSSPKNPKARACFFKWDGSALANAGVMVQLQKNPVEKDVPEYFTYLIQSKKTDGENDYNGGDVIKYKDWPGFGDDGAYSTEAGKYLWRVGNEWAFMIAFNTVLEPRAQKAAAEAFAKEVMAKIEF